MGEDKRGTVGLQSSDQISGIGVSVCTSYILLEVMVA